MARLVLPLLLLLLLGTLDSRSPFRLVQGNACNEGSETVNENDRETDEYGEEKYNGFVKVGEDFKGIKLEVHGINDTKAAYFSKEDCFKCSGNWTQLYATMKREENEINMILRTYCCRKACLINSSLSGNLIVVPDGSMYWQKDIPRNNCTIMPFLSDIDTTEGTCKDPPSTTTISNNRPSSGNNLPMWAIMLITLLILAVVGAICMVCVKWKHETSRE